MVYELADKRVIELRTDQTFTVRSGISIISGTYQKNIIDTNKFIINFNTKNKQFLLYFDLDTKAVIGEGCGVTKLKSFRKQSSKNIFRDILIKVSSIIKSL